MADDTSRPPTSPPSLVSPGNDAAGTPITVWIAFDGNAPAGCGRIMVALADAAPDAGSGTAGAGLKAFPMLDGLGGVLSPTNPRIAGSFAASAKSAANDNAAWLGAVTDDDGSELAGFFGSDVDAATLADGHSVVAWIGDDNKVHAKAVSPGGVDNLIGEAEGGGRTAELDKLLGELGHAGNAGGAGRLRLATVGQNGFAALWVADFGLTAALMGKVFIDGKSADALGTGGAGAGAAPWIIKNIASVPVPAGTTLFSLQANADGALNVRFGSSTGQFTGDHAGAGGIDVIVNLDGTPGIDGSAAAEFELAALESDAGQQSDPGLSSELVEEAPPAAATAPTPAPAAAAVKSGEAAATGAEAAPGETTAEAPAAYEEQAADALASTPDAGGALIEVAHTDLAAPGGLLDGSMADGGAQSDLPLTVETDGATAVTDAAASGGESTSAAGDTGGAGVTSNDDAAVTGTDGTFSETGTGASDSGTAGSEGTVSQAPAQTISALGGGVQQSAPKIVVTTSGTPVVVSQAPAAEPGKTMIVLTPLNAAGVPQLDAAGVPKQVIVTQNAVTSDPDHPGIELAPAVTQAASGIAVTWAETEPSDAGTIYSIKMQVSSDAGTPLTETPVTVATSDPGATLSDFSVGYIRHHHDRSADASANGGQTVVAEAADTSTELIADQAVTGDETAVTAVEVTSDDATVQSEDFGAGEIAVEGEDAGTGEQVQNAVADGADGAAVGVEDTASGVTASETSDAAPPVMAGEVVVCWVKNAGDGGYGEIMAQRYGVFETGRGSSDDDDAAASDASGDGAGAREAVELVPLGSDGTAENGNDLPFTVASVDSAGQSAAVVGRAPTVAGVGDGDIAIGWVQETAPGSGTEVIDGIVIDGASGATVLEFDLSGLMTGRLLRDCDPVIQATESGDIVIAWIERNENGGYDAAAAVYHSAGPGQWLAPGGAVHLTHFDERPDNPVLSLGGGEEPLITVAWRDGGRIEGERFDLDGAPVGDGFSAKASSGSGSGNSGSGSSGDGNSDDGSGLTASDFALAASGDGTLIVVVAQNGSDGAATIVTAVVSENDPASDAAITDAAANSANGTNSRADAAEAGETDAAGDPVTGASGDAVAEAAGDAATTVEDVTAQVAASDEDVTAHIAVNDEDSDQIRFLAAVDDDGNTSGSGGRSQSSDSDTSSSGNSGSGNSGSGNSGSGGGEGSGGEALLFVAGYGNDVADYYEEDHVFDDLGGTGLDSVFDALQFANALSEVGNLEVITFDAANVVLIKDFEAL